MRFYADLNSRRQHYGPFLMFRTCHVCLFPLKMEAVGSSETLLPIYQTSASRPVAPESH
jgi:hypothetical protein